MMFINVDLPEPLAPMMATNSDGRIRRLAPCRIRLGTPRACPAAHIVADAPHQQLDIADAPHLGERGPIERQLEWADIDAVALDQGTRAAQAFAVDIGTVGAPEVAQHNGSIHDLKRRVTARDIRMIEDDLPRHRLTADGQAVVEGDAVSHGGKPDVLICWHHSCSRGASTATFSRPYLHKHGRQGLALTQINQMGGSAELARTGLQLIWINAAHDNPALAQRIGKIVR